MRRLAVTATAVLACLLLAAPPSQAAPSPAASPGTSSGTSSALDYVALGDSYSAASGVLPPDPTAPSCARSLANYPHDIAGALGYRLTDVTCGAAETGDFFGSQYPGVAPQLDALGPGTQLVTMTIGGNDNDVFISSIVECGAAGASTAGQGSPCKDRYGTSFDDTIRSRTYPALVGALTAVHQKAPHARVAILGYPWILPPTTGCFDKMPIAEGDVPYLRDVQATLNDAVRRAAAATGTTYVDMSAVSEGHDACQPVGVRWIEPVLQGTNPVVVHPNALGEQQMASRTTAVLRLR